MVKRRTWKEKDMDKAVTEVMNKEMGLLKASNMFQVPKSTLKDYVLRERNKVGKIINEFEVVVE